MTEADRTLLTRRAALSVAAGGLLSTLATPAAAQTVLRRRGYSSIPTQSALAPFGLTRLWTGQAVFDAGADKLSSLLADEEQLFVVSEGGSVTAFDAETGGRLWSSRLGSDNRPVLRPVTNRTQVIFAVGTSLMALDKKTGMVQWELRLAALPSAGPAADDRNVYVGFENGGVAAYDLRKVRELFNDGKLTDYSYNARVWTYRTSKSISGTPITDGTFVGFASRSGVFYAVEAIDRELRYLFEGARPIISQVKATENRVIIPCEDLNTYCIDKRSGSVIWTVVTGLPVRQRPVIVGRRVYLPPGRAGLLAVDLDSGRRLWSQPRAAKFVASGGSTIYCLSSRDELLAVDAATGDLQNVIPVAGYEHHVDNERTDRMFLASTRGSIICLRQKDRNFPRYHMTPDREPIRPEFAPNKPAGQPGGEAV